MRKALMGLLLAIIFIAAAGASNAKAVLLCSAREETVAENEPRLITATVRLDMSNSRPRYEGPPPPVIPAPRQEPEPCPVTDAEIDLLAKILYRECGGLSWRGTQYGVTYRARQAAVAWCALNRLDDPRFPDTLRGVLTYPYAFAYIENTPVTDELRTLSADVVSRWWAEKQGSENVGRTLPQGYFYFYGDGKENYFRDAYQSPYNTWTWTLPDPYKEVS